MMRRFMKRPVNLIGPALMLIPGAAVLYCGVHGGGFFPGTPAFVALILIQVLILWLLLAERPLAGFSRPLAAATVLLGLYALWTLASALWSDSVARALIEFDRALLYLVALVLFGSIGRSARHVRWLVYGLAGALGFVCIVGLITRILPNVWPTTPNVANNRLSYPVTYWNTLGLMAAIAAVFCLHMASRDRGAWPARLLGAAAVPALAATVLFTFSRGAIVAGIVGLVAYLVVGRPRGMIAGLLATVPPTVVAIKVAYDADLLATADPTTPAAVAQGHHVAAVLAGCIALAVLARAALFLLDRRLSRYPTLVPRRIALPATAAVAVVGLGVFLALSGPHFLSHQYHRFAKGPGVTSTADLRQRLTDPGNNGRVYHWNAAFAGFRQNRLHGVGAGTYQLLWERKRTTNVRVQDGHSLYFEVAGELGLIGVVLIVLTVVTILLGFLMRARGPNRALYGALFATGLMWALRAGVDWDWEMPAVTLWFFAAGGVVLSARVEADDPAEATAEDAAPVAPRGAIPNAARAPIAIGLALMAVTPVLISISQNRLVTATHQFNNANCGPAVKNALSASSLLAVRPEPYEVIGYCQVERGFALQATHAMEKAVELDPNNWEYAYGLAVARGAARLDPRAQAARAHRLNPLEPIAATAAKGYAGTDPGNWQHEAEVARIAIFNSGLLSLPQ